MFGLKKAQSSHNFNAVEVLIGLAPSLVEDLARLVGSTEDDLFVSFQVMPWGDRATLAAYGIVKLDDDTKRRGRISWVSPDAVQLVNAAAEVIAGSAESTGDAHTRRRAWINALHEGDEDWTPDPFVPASEALTFVEMLTAESAVDYKLTIAGTIDHIRHNDQFDVVDVVIPADTGTQSEEAGAVGERRIKVTAANDPSMKPGVAVILGYVDDETPLSQPKVMRVGAR